MAHPFVIAIVVAVVLHDAFGALWPLAAQAAQRGLSVRAAAGQTLLAYALAMLLLVVAQHLHVRRCARRMLRRGAGLWALRAHQTVALVRVLAVLVFAVAALGFDAVEAMRALVGDWVLLDEAALTLPAFAVMVAGWWSLHPLEQQLREAALVRRFDQGAPVRPFPSRAAYVWDLTRFSLLSTLIPLGLILGLSEAAVLYALRTDPPALTDAQLTAAQLGGALLALTVSPWLLRHVWSTTPLRQGPIADLVRSVCRRHRVRVGEVLVWRTHGALLNAAVLGIVPPLRYLLLSDALLEALPTEQIEAVTAHEVGHVKRRHLLWLLVALVACFGVPVGGGLFLVEGLRAAGAPQAWRSALELTAIGAGVVVGFALLGVVSRRLEWQADAFAAQHLSTADPRQMQYDQLHRPLITTEAAQTMAGALGTVATLNGAPTHRFGWRHGSVAQRQRKLLELVGLPVDRLPIDRAVNRLKLASLAGAVLAVSLFTALPAEPASSPGAPDGVLVDASP
ncbi:MAG: hypothetical protein D6824_06650 [Planctomycetota bacterium]|nr:MAG: hypothetical protein D6824_06650 [Planctomycetota bacterium]